MGMSRLEKYAELAVKMGANVQPNQIVEVNTSLFVPELTRLIVKQAYLAGASKVLVNWNDNELTKMHYEYQSVETLCDIKEYEKERRNEPARNGACLISISSPYPGILKDIDPEKISKASKAANLSFEEQSSYFMSNKNQWCVIAAANPVWAKRVFPNLSEPAAVNKLWDEIFDAVHVTSENDPIAEWQDHNAVFAKRVAIMNDFNFKSLHFTNSKGTDLVVNLVPNHNWAGGSAFTPNKVEFNANMPTEEIFCMPDKYNVNGRVYASKPLDYQGKIVENFYFDFKDGKVVDYYAEKEMGALKALVELDEGSCYLGEVALVPYHSPISNSNVLFFNTLFDENASCHLALGEAYPENVKGGTEMTKEELAAAGANYSLAHVDFMFGTSDMSVKGVNQEGQEVDVFVNGDFVI